MPARVIMYSLSRGRAPAIEFAVKQVFKEVPRRWYVGIIGSQRNLSRWRMTVEAPDGRRTTRDLNAEDGDHELDCIRATLETLANWRPR
jgi:hypothetical protein